MMNYTDEEKNTLDLLSRTDFNATKKDEWIQLVSRISSLRPEVAKAAIEQYPELAKVFKSSVEAYKDLLDKVIQSDDSSVNTIYSIANKEIDDNSNSRDRLLDMAEKVRADCSTVLKENLTPEAKIDTINREMEILKEARSIERETREHNERILDKAIKKDSEKRVLNAGIIASAGFALLSTLGIAVSALGGDFHFQLPTKQ